MSVVEVIILLVGFACVVLGFVLPAGGMNEVDVEKTEKEIRDMVRRNVDGADRIINEKIDDAVEERLVKAERGLERITNEKISAISEFSNTVLDDIKENQKHSEFLYEMVNDKHKTLSSEVSELTQKTMDAKQAVLDAELTSKEAKQVAMQASDFAGVSAQNFSVPDFHINTVVPNTNMPQSPYDVPASQGNLEAGISQEPPVYDQEFQPLNSGTLTGQERLIRAASFPVINRENAGNLSPSEVQRPATAPYMESVHDAAPAEILENAQSETIADSSMQNMQILEMHKAGKSNMVIARELGVGVGEVGLVIELSKKHRSKKAK